jgi:FKBP-type peptidyl-prolyl cis-trans isomerase FkpA
MNKKLLFVFTAVALSFTFLSCLKSKSDTPSNCVPNTTGIPTAAEIASLQSYLTANSIIATQDSRGFFYSIVNAGFGVTPSNSSTVVVKYIGKLENGTTFDQNSIPAGNTFQLSQLIKGWQYGIPLIKKGGTIKLYLPPTLAYGCTAIGAVPAGANLIFTVDLVDVL